MTITYKNASYRSGSYGSGKLVRRIEASCGQLRRFGANRTEAKVAILEAIAEQCEHAYVRRYIPAGDSLFVLSYADGWRYDIVRNDGHICGSTQFGDGMSEWEATAYVRKHAEQYAEATV